MKKAVLLLFILAGCKEDDQPIKPAPDVIRVTVQSGKGIYGTLRARELDLFQTVIMTIDSTRPDKQVAVVTPRIKYDLYLRSDTHQDYWVKVEAIKAGDTLTRVVYSKFGDAGLSF